MDSIHIFFPNGPPPPAAPPTSSSSLPSDEKDEELVKRITKLAEFSARNGPSFVDMVNTKQKDNPEYAFLRGGEGSDFWKWTLYNQLCRQRQPAEAQKIPIDLLQGWSGILSGLKPTQDSIYSAQAWFASRPEHFMQMALMVGQRAMTGACPDFPGSLSLVFLVNDIFMKAMAQNNLRIVVPAFLQMLQNGSNPLIEIFKCAGHHAAGRPERVQQLMNIVNTWRQHGIIEQHVVDILINHVCTHPSSSLQHQPPPPPGQPHMQHGPPIAMLARQSGGAQRPVAHPMTGQANNGPHLFQQHPNQFEIQPYAHPGGQGAFRPELRFQQTPALGAAVARVPIETIQAKPESIEPAFDSFSFPPGLIPYLVEDKLKTDPPYSPLSPLDIEKCPVPPPPNEDEYLKARLDKFYAELADYRPGMTYCDLLEGPEAVIANTFPSRASRGKVTVPITVQTGNAVGLGTPVGVDGNNGYMAGGATAGLGFGRGNEVTEQEDVFSVYRKMRSSNYHTTLARESLEKRHSRR